jgi:hypothetical protein
MRNFVRFAQEFSQIVLGHSVEVEFTNQITDWGACYGPKSPLHVNKVLHGKKWFEGTVVERTQDWARLLIHEFAHDKVSDHLSSEFHEECCKLGAKYAARLQRELALATGDDRTADEDAVRDWGQA